MEMAFQRSDIRCLRMVLSEVQNVEMTQEIRVPEDLPDVDNIISAWGQVIARGKEWRSDSVRFSGGMMVWIAYSAEGVEGTFCLDTWIPFQADWILPEGTPEGTIAVTPLTRFVDARSVSPKRIMVRAGVGALGEIYCPGQVGICCPEGKTEDAQLLRTRFSARLPKESGEKSFELEEEIAAGESFEGKPVYYTVKTEVSEQKVLANKIAFRGSCLLHMLYSGENGDLTAKDYSLPFSQIVELNGSHGSDAQVQIRMCVTNLELEEKSAGGFTVKCSVSGQYVVDDIAAVEIIEDAYLPGRKITMEREMIELPAIAEKKVQNLTMEQTISAEAAEIVEATILPDFPKQFREGKVLSLEIPGTVHLLFRTASGGIKSSTARWEGKMDFTLSENTRLTAIPGFGPLPQVSVGNASVHVQGELPLQIGSMGVQDISMITGLEIGDETELDPQRPSLILRKAGKLSLWELARTCGSTVEAIRKANALQDEPKNGQMLLIPVV